MACCFLALSYVFPLRTLHSSQDQNHVTYHCLQVFTHPVGLSILIGKEQSFSNTRGMINMSLNIIKGRVDKQYNILYYIFCNINGHLYGNILKSYADLWLKIVKIYELFEYQHLD